jgi:hypothetical protein
MYVEAKLILQYYIPIIENHLINTEYMFYEKNTKGEPYVYTLSGIRDIEAFMNANGYPVKPNILLPGNPNIDGSDAILTTSDQIGWIDDGADSDSLRDLEVKDFNEIIQDDDFNIMIEVDDETDEPILYEGKVCLMRVNVFEEEYDDDEEDWSDDDYNPHY